MVENNFNTNASGANTPNGHQALTDENAVGANCSLDMSGMDNDGSIPVENVSFSEEANTSEVQYTGSFAQSIAVTGVSYSGSFDIPGNANNVRDAAWDDADNDDNTTLPTHVSNLSIQDTQGKIYTFQQVLLNSHSKDIPSDDRTSQSFDFMAEKLIIETA